jgi:hypothetical protein
MRQTTVRSAVLSLLVVGAFAGCWRKTPPRPAVANVKPPSTIRLRGPELAEVTLVASTALPDGGLVIVGASPTGVRVGADVRCKVPTEGTFIARFTAAGELSWMRCVPGQNRYVVAAASASAVWIARIVRPTSSPQTDFTDLIVADRFTAAGEPAGSRVVSVFHDPGKSSSAYNAAENMQINAAVLAGDELVIAGTSKTGAIVDGQWTIEDSGISLHGFVLAVPAAGPVRSIFDSADTLFEDLSIANGRFVASGWCSTSARSSASPIARAVSPRVTCRHSTTGFSVDGDVAGQAPPRIRVYGSDTYDVRSAIAGDGSVVIAATSWRSPLTFEGITIESKCAKFAFAVKFSPQGPATFARALGDCMQPVSSPYSYDGGASSAADDRISDHTFEIRDVAIVDGEPAIVVGVSEETNHLDWPVRFDGVKVSVPFADSAVLLVLDTGGKIVRHRELRFTGTPESSTEPDASLSSSAGIHRVIVATAGSHTWLVIAHGGSLEIDGTAYRLHAGFQDRWPRERERERVCKAASIRRPPNVAEVVDSIKNGVGEPDDFGCRRSVTAEIGITALQL